MHVGPLFEIAVGDAGVSPEALEFRNSKNLLCRLGFEMLDFGHLGMLEFLNLRNSPKEINYL